MHTKSVEFHIVVDLEETQDVDEVKQMLLDIADDYSCYGATIDVVEG